MSLFEKTKEIWQYLPRGLWPKFAWRDIQTPVKWTNMTSSGQGKANIVGTGSNLDRVGARMKPRIHANVLDIDF